MKTKTKILGLAVAIMALSAPMVYADAGTGDKDSVHQDGDGHRPMHEHMTAKILNLSEDQEKQLKDLKQKQRDAKKTNMEQMKSNREAFEAEIIKATPDMGKINDLQSQIKTIQGQIVDAHLNNILDIKKLLTPEQFAGYMALEKEEDMMKEFHHGFEHKDWSAKEGDEHRHWGNKSEKDEDEK